MRQRERAAIALHPGLVLSLALAAACAGGPEEEPGTPDTGARIVVEVENNLTPAASVIVLVDPETRPERVLGPVSPGETRSFELRTAVIPHRYRLIAERGGAPRIVSRLIQIVDDAIVHWNLNLEMVTVREMEGG